MSSRPLAGRSMQEALLSSDDNASTRSNNPFCRMARRSNCTFFCWPHSSCILFPSSYPLLLPQCRFLLPPVSNHIFTRASAQIPRELLAPWEPPTLEISRISRAFLFEPSFTIPRPPSSSKPRHIRGSSPLLPRYISRYSA